MRAAVCTSAPAAAPTPLQRPHAMSANAPLSPAAEPSPVVAEAGLSPAGEAALSPAARSMGSPVAQAASWRDELRRAWETDTDSCDAHGLAERPLMT